MKTLASEKTNLALCLAAAKSDRVVVTKRGKPVALLVNIQGLDAEQVELGTSDKFWKLIGARRREKAISRDELDARLAAGRRGKRSR